MNIIQGRFYTITTMSCQGEAYGVKLYNNKHGWIKEFTIGEAGIYQYALNKKQKQFLDTLEKEWLKKIKKQGDA